MNESTHPVFTDGTHVLISGTTGAGADFGGKSAVANWWLDTAVPSHFDYGIAFSPKGNRFRGAPTVTNAREAARTVNRGTRSVEWSLDSAPTELASESMSDAHGQAMSFAHGLNGSVLAIHDDAVMYSDSDSLAWATALAGNPSDGGGRVKSLVVTQDPWDLPRKAVRSNLPVMVWVGPLGDDAQRYFDSMKKAEAANKVREAHTEPYMWSVIDGSGDVTTYAPVPEKYA